MYLNYDFDYFYFLSCTWMIVNYVICIFLDNIF
ncbi:hypothetical protein Leryth_021848 [Lithospermum erythrorhizon]|nr:hypothetical protein Leryth_021848 [Lithospermum erythrorhizon]